MCANQAIDCQHVTAAAATGVGRTAFESLADDN